MRSEEVSGTELNATVEIRWW